jgi:NitT/TauT family transport system substrate-binding protein
MTLTRFGRHGNHALALLLPWKTGRRLLAASPCKLIVMALALLAMLWRPALAQTDLTPLRVQIYPGAYTSMSVHVADELGIFTRNKLKVEKIPAQSSSAAVAALIGGSLDIVETGAEFPLSNQDKGIDIKYVSANEVKNYATVVVSGKVALPNLSKGYPAMMQDLKGLRVGVNAIGATLHLAALMMLTDAGMNKDDVQFVATGTGANTFAAWKAGAVDAQLTFAPIPELLEALGLAKPVMILGETGPDILRFQGLYSGWVARGDFIQKNKSTVDAYIKSIQESIDWIRNPVNNARLIELARKYSPVSGLTPSENDAVLQKVVQNYRRFWGTEISEETIDKWNDYSLRNGLIKRRVPFDRVVYSGAPKCTTECK